MQDADNDKVIEENNSFKGIVGEKNGAIIPAAKKPVAILFNISDKTFFCPILNFI